ncbi:putative LRR receptor-like serine/threonine-protein kinase [Hordeum vulgare]|nr:putative LRR receptor-like serine/threonine-protein kinase [Hordeum vulgare]
MLPKKTPKGKSGLFGVRAKPFGNFRVEFTDAGRRWWLGMYPTADEVVRAYNVYVEAELEHYSKCDVEAKKKGVKKEDEADPSTVIPIKLSDEDWSDSDKEDEGCDDPDKDEFWE